MNTKSGNSGRWWRLAVVALVGVVGVGVARWIKGLDRTSPDQATPTVQGGTASPATAPDVVPEDSGSSSGEALTYVPNQLILVGDRTMLDPKGEPPFSFITDLGYTGTVALVDGYEPHNSPKYGPDAASLTSDPVLLKMISYQEESQESFISLMVNLEAMPEEGILSLCERINASTFPVIASPNYYLTTSQPKVSPWDGRPVSVHDPSLQYDVMRCTTLPNRCNLPHPPAIGGSQTIKVGVFDSSPYSAPGANSLTPSLASPWDRTFDHIRQAPYPGLAGADPNFPNHGIFVAGLIRAFAPEADVTLYKAFDEDGVSTLGTVQMHLEAFVNPMPQDERFIVNLSCNVNGSAGSATFESVLLAARNRGGITVASAGNVPQGNTGPQQPYYPATLVDFVIPVGGANSSRQRSCFSTDAPNLQFAYAGDGMASASGTPCYTTNPSDAVASIVADAEPPNYTDFKVAGWAGTSFAAAIISAQAARELAAWATCDAGLTGAGRFSQFKADLQKQANKWSGTKVVNLAAMDQSCH